MRVLCINDNWGPHSWSSPVIGDKDEVLNSVDFFGHLYYQLVRFGVEYVYDARFFIELPDEEMEEVKEVVSEGYYDWSFTMP